MLSLSRCPSRTKKKKTLPSSSTVPTKKSGSIALVELQDDGGGDDDHRIPTHRSLPRHRRGFGKDLECESLKQNQEQQLQEFKRQRERKRRRQIRMESAFESLLQPTHQQPDSSELKHLEQLFLYNNESEDDNNSITKSLPSCNNSKPANREPAGELPPESSAKSQSTDQISNYPRLPIPNFSLEIVANENTKTSGSILNDTPTVSNNGNEQKQSQKGQNSKIPIPDFSLENDDEWSTLGDDPVVMENSAPSSKAPSNKGKQMVSTGIPSSEENRRTRQSDFLQTRDWGNAQASRTEVDIIMPDNRPKTNRKNSRNIGNDGNKKHPAKHSKTKFSPFHGDANQQVPPENHIEHSGPLTRSKIEVQLCPDDTVNFGTPASDALSSSMQDDGQSSLRFRSVKDSLVADENDASRASKVENTALKSNSNDKGANSYPSAHIADSQVVNETSFEKGIKVQSTYSPKVMESTTAETAAKSIRESVGMTEDRVSIETENEERIHGSGECQSINDASAQKATQTSIRPINATAKLKPVEASKAQNTVRKSHSGEASHLKIEQQPSCTKTISKTATHVFKKDKVKSKEEKERPLNVKKQIVGGSKISKTPAIKCIEMDIDFKPASSSNSHQGKRRGRRGLCALCTTCPCRKPHSEETTGTLGLQSFARSDSAMEKALIRRLKKIEKSVENLQDQHEMIKRKLKKHQRDFLRKKRKLSSNNDDDRDISYFLPDAEELDSFKCKPSKISDDWVMKAQERIFPTNMGKIFEFRGVSIHD